MKWSTKTLTALLCSSVVYLSTSVASAHPGNGTSLGPMPRGNSGLSCPRHSWGCATPQEKWQVKQALYDEFGRGWEGRLAVCVSYAESGHNPYAANFSDGYGGSYGSMQMNMSHRGWINFKRIYDPEYSAKVAHRLVRSSGWPNWTTLGKCR